jgi:hypothetical protein
MVWIQYITRSASDHRKGGHTRPSLCLAKYLKRRMTRHLETFQGIDIMLFLAMALIVSSAASGGVATCDSAATAWPGTTNPKAGINRVVILDDKRVEVNGKAMDMISFLMVADQINGLIPKPAMTLTAKASVGCERISAIKAMISSRYGQPIVQ